MSLDEERDVLVTEIETAFDSVTREGGMSWRESEIADFYGAPELASWIDSDTRWQDIADDPNWSHGAGLGGFSFLDPIGFRYFLPAAMIQAIRSPQDEGIQFHLTIPPPDDHLREHRLNQISLLDDRQKRCVRRFIEYMIAVWEAEDVEYCLEREAWREALQSHWHQF